MCAETVGNSSTVVLIVPAEEQSHGEVQRIVSE